MATYSPILLARFWSKVDVRANCECWQWNGAVGTNGYGRIKVTSKSVVHAHRVAWEMFSGERLGNRFACHTCDNKLCVNPHHIYAGDHGSNTRDAHERGRFVSRIQSGSHNNNAQLTETDVVKIKKMIAAGMTNRAIARDFPVSDAMVSRIRKGRSWAHVGSVDLEENRTDGAKSLKEWRARLDSNQQPDRYEQRAPSLSY